MFGHFISPCENWIHVHFVLAFHNVSIVTEINCEYNVTHIDEGNSDQIVQTQISHSPLLYLRDDFAPGGILSITIKCFCIY